MCPISNKESGRGIGGNWMDGQMDQQTEGGMDGQIDRWIDGLTGGWTD